MNRSTKAALLSGLVFPGLGQIYLRRYVRGALLVFCAGLALYVILSTAIDAALDVVAKMEGGEVPADVGAISELVRKESLETGQTTSIATIGLFLSWLFGIVDAYRIGQAQGRNRGGGGEKTR